MENCNTHNTHNLSYTSSEAQYNLNNKTSSSSSEEECIEGNKSQNEWSKIIRCNSSKAITNGILSESEINITNKSYEDNKENKLINKSNKTSMESQYNETINNITKDLNENKLKVKELENKLEISEKEKLKYEEFTSEATVSASKDKLEFMFAQFQNCLRDDDNVDYAHQNDIVNKDSEEEELEDYGI